LAAGPILDQYHRDYNYVLGVGSHSAPAPTQTGK